MQKEFSQLPTDFIAQMQTLLGQAEAKNLFQALEGKTPTTVRYNPAKAFEDQIPAALETIPWTSTGYYLAERPQFTADPSLHAGAYYVQEASSMFLEQAIKQHIQEEAIRALDLCAAPGGKSTLIEQLLPQGSLLVANEVIRSRAHILAENVQKWGSDKIWVVQNDPAEFKNLEGFFDLIVVDAPCSGEGMFRKAPKSASEWSLQAVQHCSLRQQRILHDIWPALRPGGLLIYSTCTYNLSENEENLIRFRAQNEFDSLPITIDPSWGMHETHSDGIVGYRCYPHRVEGEGFFLSVLRKSGDSEAKIPRIKKPSLLKAPKNEGEQLLNWIQDPSKFTIGQKGETLLAVPKDQWLAAEAIDLYLRVVYAGCELAEITRKELKPLPAAALWSGLKASNFVATELKLEDALRFLRLDPLETSVFAESEGWQLVTYKGLGLGWVKKLSNRANNYYPKEWKIRKTLDSMLDYEG